MLKLLRAGGVCTKRLLAGVQYTPKKALPDTISNLGSNISIFPFSMQ
jgi:hypothetical protein